MSVDSGNCAEFMELKILESIKLLITSEIYEISLQSQLLLSNIISDNSENLDIIEKQEIYEEVIKLGVNLKFEEMKTNNIASYVLLLQNLVYKNNKSFIKYNIDTLKAYIIILTRIYNLINYELEESRAIADKLFRTLVYITENYPKCFEFLKVLNLISQIHNDI